MNPKDFFDKVVAMREAQKQYFKSRSSIYLTVSKKLEKEIDQEIARVQKLTSAEEPSLFK